MKTGTLEELNGKAVMRSISINVAIWAGFYATFAFVSLEPNAANWTSFSRGAYVLLAAYASFVWLMRPR